MAEKRGKSTIRSYLLPIAIVLALAAGVALLLPVYRSKQKKEEELYRLRQKLAEKEAERNARARESDLGCGTECVASVWISGFFAGFDK